MSPAISKPGPPRTSCLTCHRRRKKCDLSRPYCKRCTKGGYQCLGYEGSKPGARVHQGVPNASIPSRIPPISSTEPAEAPGSKTQDPVVVESSEGRQNPVDVNRGHSHRHSVVGAALLYRMDRPISSADNGCTPSGSLESFDRSWPQEQNQLTVYSRRQSSCSIQPIDTASNTGSTRNDINRFIEALRRSIPRSVDATQMMREDHTLGVIREYYLQRLRFWFMIPPASISDSLTTRFKSSKMAVRTMYLGAKLFQVLSQDSTAARGCTGWIDDLERKASTDSHSNLPVNDTANYLMIRLELSFLKFATVDTASGYNLLRKALPMFFQLVATETDLYKEHPNGSLVVSFLRTLNSTPHEFQRFVIYDTISALILGVPPLVEYGYDGGCDSSSYVFEWVHGIPLTLVEIVSQVNSWRAGSRVPLDDWKTMESRVLAWSPPPAVPGDDPAENVSVARSAVQESWRQVVLIYIYMGICGVSSHDSRVQASVHRIVQLGETVANLPIGIHVFAHCIVAGLAAKLEKHRVLIHKMLLSFTGTRAWLFRGPQFGEVLYHLWHGVGLGGGPVKWDDYVQSRCAVMPI